MRTLERLGLLYEPIKPATLEADGLELGECTALVRLRVVRELGAFDEGEDNRVLEPGKDTTDAVEVQWVTPERKVEERGGHRRGGSGGVSYPGTAANTDKRKSLCPSTLPGFIAHSPVIAICGVQDTYVTASGEGLDLGEVEA